MWKSRHWLCSAAIVATFVCMFVPRGALARESETRLKTFTDALKRDGFDVNAGIVKVRNLAEDWCSNTPGVAHAIYTNKEPYLFLFVPESADQSAEQTTDFKLWRDEAIVLVGKTPPPERYFGFYTFLAKRTYPDGVRREIGSSVVDPVNNATIKTGGPTPFNTPVVLIFTPDRGTDSRVRAALLRAGYPAAIINTVTMPPSILSLGHGDDADEFRLAMRNAIWLEGQEDAGNSYILDAADNLHVFRVTPRSLCSADDCEPFPMPPLRVRGTGQTEVSLWNKLVELRAGIVAANEGLHSTEIPIGPAIGYETYDYMQRGEWEGGDARDAFVLDGGYLPEFGPKDAITLADDEFLMAFGANHVATGKATYMSINVYTGEEKDGKLSIGAVDDRNFVGTALPYLPSGDPAASLMYAYKLSRRCGDEPNCLQLPSVQDCPRLDVGPSTLMGVIFRMYLEPPTKTGAAMPEVLYDRVLKFSPRAPTPP